MKRIARNTLLIIALSTVVFSQIVSAQVGVDSTKNNGQIDDITEFSTIITVPFTMADGVHLMTDVYLPMVSDCMLVEAFPGVMIELIPKGTQIIFYDSITPPDTISTNPLKLNWNLYDPQNLIPNPNPYQMPLIFTRTPYDKEGADEASLMSILGYIYAMQDMRGRYSSEGVYMPMYSDGWSKVPYHPTWGHVLDAQTPISDPRHGNKHEDGYNSVQFILDSLTRTYRLYDPDSDGVPNIFPVSTGNIGTFGASALGNTQYTEAAAYPIDPTLPGMKCILPIVATNEHYKYTGYPNGVFRDRIVTGWVKGQIFTGIDDDSASVDNYFYDIDKALGPAGVHNSLHTSWDYDQPNKFIAANAAIDHFTATRYNNGVAGYYPNSTGRADMDASRAVVNANGEGDVNGTYNRYKNMEVPGYHLFGWWDIFVDGQIETVNYIRKHTSAKNKQLQKMVIGPWVHQTIGGKKSTNSDEVPDMYPDNVTDVLGFDLGGLGDEDVLPLSKIFTSQIVSWYRYNLNYTKGLGEPKVIIPESKKWQSGGGVEIDSGLGITLDSIRIPAADFIIPFNDFFNFMAGNSGLPDIAVEIQISIGGIPLPPVDTVFPVPAPTEAIFPGLDTGGVEVPKFIDFLDTSIIPNVQFYVVGDQLDNTVGNYWFGADSFPLVNDIKWTKMYLHQNGTLNKSEPISDEGYKIYVHDPDDPILTIGGANMIVRDPLDSINSQGQMDLASSAYEKYTNRQGIVSFTGPPITEANGYPGDSLCIIGFPVATLYAKSSPGGVMNGPTDTDFFIRILDVYPDGRELFVVEGCVNARARNYVRNLVEYPNWDNTIPYSNDDTPFTNIEIGQIYEYKFKMLPIAYVWGAGHKIKILISSSNYTRYQVNPNLPIEPGDFFRRKPGDGRKYTFEGALMEPRVAVQRIAFSDIYPTNVKLPVFTPGFISGNEETNIKIENLLDALIYPNPARDYISIYMNRNGSFEISLFNTLGQVILNTEFEDDINIEVSDLEKGLYFLEISAKDRSVSGGRELKGNDKIVRKISVM